MSTRVINVATAKPDYIDRLIAADQLVVVTRPSKWGNPYAARRFTADSLARWIVPTREDAIREHAIWLLGQPELMRALPELKGKILGCVCAPLPCHACTLAHYADEYPVIQTKGAYGLTSEIRFDSAGYVIGAGFFTKRPVRPTS